MKKGIKIKDKSYHVVDYVVKGVIKKITGVNLQVNRDYTYKNSNGKTKTITTKSFSEFKKKAR